MEVPFSVLKLLPGPIGIKVPVNGAAPAPPDITAAPVAEKTVLV